MFDSPWDKPNVAKEIDEYWNCQDEAAARKVVVADLKPHLQDGDIADIGCGSGRIYETLRDFDIIKEHRYRGYDGSREMVAIAKNRYKRVRFEHADLIEIDKPAANVICINVLQHVDDWQVATNKMLELAEKMLYVVAWFAGTASRKYDSGTGFWNNWLDHQKFVALCESHGQVISRMNLWGTVGSVTVHK